MTKNREFSDVSGTASHETKKIVQIEEINLKTDNSALSLRLILTVSIVTLSSHFHFGYQAGIPNTAQTVLKEFFNNSYERQLGEPATPTLQTWIWALHVGSFQLMAVVGCLLTQHTVDRIGRRGVFIMIAIISTLSGISGYSSYYLDLSELLFISRIGYGIVLGGGMAASSIYLTEITPTKYRGSVNVFGSVVLRGVHVVALILGSPQVLGTRGNWPNLYMIELIVSIIHLGGVLFFVKESPTYLMGTGRRSQAAMVIQEYHGESSNFIDVMDSIDEEIKMSSGSLGLWQVLCEPTIRRGALLGMVAAISQGVSGSAILCMFSTYLLTSNGLPDQMAAWASVAMGVAGVIAVLMLTFTVEKFGRRPMMLMSLVVLILCNVAMKAISFAYPYSDGNWLFIVHTLVLMLFLFAFSLGVGPISWFLASELVPVNARAASQSCASSMAFFFLGIGPLYFIPLYDSVSAFAFLTLIIPPCICFAILYKWMPETKQRSIMEIMMVLNGIDQKDLELKKKEDQMNRDSRTQHDSDGVITLLSE